MLELPGGGGPCTLSRTRTGLQRGRPLRQEDGSGWISVWKLDCESVFSFYSVVGENL